MEHAIYYVLHHILFAENTFLTYWKVTLNKNVVKDFTSLVDLSNESSGTISFIEVKPINNLNSLRS